MKFEFALLYQIICGELAPVNHAIDTASALLFLKKRFAECIRHYSVQFKYSSSGKYTFQKVRSTTFLEVSLFTPHRAIPLVDDQLKEYLINLSLPHVAICREDIKSVSVSALKSNIVLHISAITDFHKLTDGQILYYFYHTHLSDEVKRIKEVFTNRAFSLTSEKQIELFIQNHQQALETLMQEVLENLQGFELENIYTLSEERSITDVCKQIYTVRTSW